MYYFQNIETLILHECKHGKHKTAFQARKVTGTFQKMAPASLYFVRLVEARQRRRGAADRKDDAKEKSMKKIQSF